MLRTIIYEWMCNKCGDRKELRYEVREFEEIPIPRDPPLGWNKFCRDEHLPNLYFCPNCVKVDG